MATQDHSEDDKLNDYSIGGKSVKGGNGHVFEARRKSDGMPVAVKRIPRKKPGIPGEVFWLNRVSSIRGCIKMVDHFPGDGEYIIILERPERYMDLWEYPSTKPDSRVPESEARALFRQSVKTLRRLHKAGILHGDVKPDNLLLDTDTFKVKVIDFGNAEAVREQASTNFGGTYGFEPPEFLANSSFDGLPSTVWALGVTLFYLTNGDLPFQEDKDILDGTLIYRQPGRSAELKNLIEVMLRRDPSQRPGFAAILAHPWLQQK